MVAAVTRKRRYVRGLIRLELNDGWGVPLRFNITYRRR
jgi:hypothetical protein